MTLPHGFGSRGSKEDRKRPREINMMAIGALVLISLLGIYIGHAGIYHSENIYPIDQAKKELYNAYETPNVSQKMIYLQTALDGLPVSGNTAFFFPTTLYEWGDVRKVMQQMIIEGKELSLLASVDNMAYQQAIPNYNHSIDQIEMRIGNMLTAQGFNPALNPIAYIIMIVGIISIPAMIKLDTRLQNSFYEKARNY